MKKSSVNFWKKNLGFFKLAIITNLEYRLNYFTDAIAQPVISALIEITLWLAVFRVSSAASVGGFTREYYLSYAIWGAFISRIASSWMYEFNMVNEIDSGSVNGLLVRPMTFYEYYLSQFLGYKLITTVISLIVPFAAAYFFHLPTIYHRLPLAMALVLYYLILVHTLSYCITSCAFFFNRVSSFTIAKNLCLWLFSGELFPLDLISQPWKNILLSLPFSNAVYTPVAYITGRTEISTVLHGFYSVTIGLLFFGLLGHKLWTSGLKKYSGTGA